MELNSSGTGTRMSNVERIFTNIKWRFGGIVKALTTEVEEFYNQCDPDKENLALYGLSDGSWKVSLPADEVPPDLPEPAVGINFARDEMSRKEWLALIALHSDAWLVALASFYAAGLTRSERKRIFMMMGDLPTAFDIVMGRDAGDENESSVDQINNGCNPKERHQDHACETSSHLPMLNLLDLPLTITSEKRAVPVENETGDKGEPGYDAATSEHQALPMPDPTFLLDESHELPQTCPQEMQHKVGIDPSGPARETEAQSSEENHSSAVACRIQPECAVRTALPFEVERLRLQTSAAPSDTGTKQLELSEVKLTEQTVLVAESSDDEIDGYLLADEYIADEVDDDALVCEICKGHELGEDDKIFWIACDCCEKWYHGKCVKITSAKAEYMKHFKCPSCTRKRAIIPYL